MKKLLVLGAGLVAKPLVDYFLAREGFQVEVADLVPERAQGLVAGRPRGRARGLDVEDDASLSSLIEACDLAVSFLPAGHHPRVARVCLSRGRHLVTASYLSPAMKALDGEAKARGLVFLNEAGLDPGLDHMEAMRVIDLVRGQGGMVTEFLSYCGGLPAPESNTNPFGYKFSWSPLGVLLASKSSARFLWEGREVVLPAEEVFDRPAEIAIDGLGRFEGYPNRDSMSYLELYGLPRARTMLRGTLRYPGWCRTLKRIKEFGLLDDRRLDRSGISLGQFTAASLGLPAGEDPASHVSALHPQPEDRDVWTRLEWLGLFSDRPLPARAMSGLEIMTELMADRLRYRAGERDMVVLQHRITAEFPDGRRESFVSTLVDYGLPGGDSAMARTVSLPAAVCSRLVLEGQVGDRGVLIPVRPELYLPVLEEVRRLGIRFQEDRVRLP